MPDLVRTCHGPVERDLAAATRRVMAVLAAPALITLDELHLRLGIVDASMGVVPAAERPTCRWAGMTAALFPSPMPTHSGWRLPSLRVRGMLNAARPEHRQRLGRLLLDAGAFLAAEASVLQDQIELAGLVHRNRRRPFEPIPTQARSRLLTVSTHSMTLITHSHPDKLGHLLPATRDRILDHRCRSY